jgi:hypothetical protein
MGFFTLQQAEEVLPNEASAMREAISFKEEYEGSIAPPLLRRRGEEVWYRPHPVERSGHAQATGARLGPWHLPGAITLRCWSPAM